MVEPSDVAVWWAALSDAALLEAVARCDPGDVAAVARLRKMRGDADVVRAALSIVAAREKGERKFGSDAARLFADVEGVEQATSLDAARPKAVRFARLLDAGFRERGPVLDLGCGIGADAWAMRLAGVDDVLAVDLDPVRAAMAEHNAGVPSRVADLNTIADGGALDVRDRFIHLDPARRARSASETKARRTFALDELEPGPATLRRLIERSAGAAVKLSPGIDISEVREALGDGEACFTSEPAGLGHGEARKLTQAVWFTGALRETPAVEHEASRRAVCLRDDGSWRQAHDAPIDARDLDVSALSRYLVVPDPAVERAELLAQLGLPTLHPGLGLLTGDRLPGDGVNGLWRGYEVLAEMPWRPAKVKRWLADHDATINAVKTRGKACDPDSALRELRGGAKKSAASGDAALTLFVLRLGTPVVAILTRPLGTTPSDDAA
ncbi:MAG: hypothetical protein AAGF84_12130 [Planctomycetota bacterium]